MKKKITYIDGLNERYISQIIRRKMLQKYKPSSKIYKREKVKNDEII